MKYKRILLKLSGESLMGNDGYGISSSKLDEYISQIMKIHKLGVEIGIVIGGGNIFRGIQGTDKGFDRVKGDQMGMLATVINGLALQSTFSIHNITSRVFTAFRMEPVGTFYSRDRAVESIQNGEIAMFTAGTGNPYFTTDTAAALRAVEINADILLKGTRVDGVYTADPEKDPKATKYKSISFEEAIQKNLKVMDQTAFSLCKENNLPIYVFDMDTVGNLEKVISGKQIGTLIE